MKRGPGGLSFIGLDAFCNTEILGVPDTSVLVVFRIIANVRLITGTEE